MVNAIVLAAQLRGDLPLLDDRTDRDIRSGTTLGADGDLAAQLRRGTEDQVDVLDGLPGADDDTGPVGPPALPSSP